MFLKNLSKILKVNIKIPNHQIKKFQTLLTIKINMISFYKINLRKINL